jgi:hypothetical protein
VLFCLVSPYKRAGKGNIDLASIPVVREFRDVFPEELSGLPPVEKLNFPYKLFQEFLL